jgi:hypothetical protein
MQIARRSGRCVGADSGSSDEHLQHTDAKLHHPSHLPQGISPSLTGLSPDIAAHFEMRILPILKEGGDDADFESCGNA